MTLALGIDPGTATTGYGLVRLMRDGELVAVSYGVISTPKDATASARLEMLFDQLNDLIKENKPDTVEFGFIIKLEEIIEKNIDNDQFSVEMLADLLFISRKGR